ncbi:electron transfer flavoprotein subunit beta/FixA family protein [Georgenia sp. Z1491]|uniref:electron transfer flavoprotein subunit beta/FixA family protein n=1 Tax=Georgenia sp. Z1491 TaxID=3416707 RepID=UPI003CEA096B
MKIVVLVKHVPDPEEPAVLAGEDRRIVREGGVLSETDSRAIAVAEELRGDGDTVTALTMGPALAEPSLRKALAAGADDAVHVLDDRLAGADALTTARVLAAAVTRLDADLVLAGNLATDGMGGMVPAMLAELLGLPHVTHVEDVSLDADVLSARRVSGPVARTVSAPVPLVASVVEQAAEPRIPNFMGLRSARTKLVEVLGLDDLGLDVPRAAWRVTGAEPAAERTRAELVTDTDEAVERIVDLLTSTGTIGAAT